ncbi:hypothetical protein PHYBOEH_005800 [Phytophthora boehmeriae]|uniref:Elicitin n=1 Tax=Phytophthora boehmeriae TaxID=109152 RepID=A0A8T1X3A1_9STRA|nr:hypothetical protein PHYBOEH_005800 [Phytophthora boehmeriae]
MKTSTISVIAVLSATVGAVSAADPDCDLAAIEGSLLANGTKWHDSCTGATGYDVFQSASLPTNAQAKQIFQNRDCVNYLNQLNQQANSKIQCTTHVGDQTVNFGELLTAFLTGKNGNKTKEATVGSDSESGSVELSLSGSGSESESASDSSSESASGSSALKKKKNGSASSSGSADQRKDDSDIKKSGASAATISAIAAVATVALSFAL